MPINSRTTTADPNACRLDKANAISFTLQVTNQSILYELNVAAFGRGENWVPNGGAILLPGFWTFNADDWAEYGVARVQGIRCRAVAIATPGIVSIS